MIGETTNTIETNLVIALRDEVAAVGVDLGARPEKLADPAIR